MEGKGEDNSAEQTHEGEDRETGGYLWRRRSESSSVRGIPWLSVGPVFSETSGKNDPQGRTTPAEEPGPKRTMIVQSQTEMDR